MRNKARNFFVAVVALAAVLWTLAGLVTLVYWSGLAWWMCAAAGAAGFVWTLRVYLRPSAAVRAEIGRSSNSR
jgi:hypothetical protein